MGSVASKPEKRIGSLAMHRRRFCFPLPPMSEKGASHQEDKDRERKMSLFSEYKLKFGIACDSGRPGIVRTFAFIERVQECP